MNRLRAFIVVSFLALTGSAWACYVPEQKSVDNMIYRLVEDVSPYYNFLDDHTQLYAHALNRNAENLALWRAQTKCRISEESLRWYVYQSTQEELQDKRKKAVKLFGEDGYRLLCIAKQCETFRRYIADPWYYPYKGDTLIQNIESKLEEVRSYRGRYATRYALQTLRIPDSLMRYQEAVTTGNRMPSLWTMMW